MATDEPSVSSDATSQTCVSVASESSKDNEIENKTASQPSTACNGSTSEPLLVANGVDNGHSPQRPYRPGGSKSNLMTGLALAKSCSFRELSLTENPHRQIERQEAINLTCSEKLKLKQNLYVIAVCFMLVYSAFNAMQNLASSLLQADSLGLISLSCVYLFAIISCFLGPWIIKTCTPKWSLVGGFVLVTLFLASMLYPRLYTLIPSSILWGVASGPFWTVASLYVTTSAMDYGVSVQGSVPGYVSQFTGIWMMFQQMSQIIGNLISSLVLGFESEVADPDPGRVCGAGYDRNYYNESRNSTTEEFAESALLLLGSIYITLAVIATLIAVVFLKPFRHCQTKMDYGSVLSFVEVLTDRLPTRELLASTFHLMARPKMYLIIPLSYMVGMQMSYLFADFTQAFVACGLGVNYIGFTMIAFGVANALGCYLGGRLYSILGRVSLYTIAFALNLGLYLTMLLWQPSSGYAVYFAVPAVWGLVDAIVQPQTMAFLGYLFPTRQEIAFSNFNLFKNLGMATTFAYSGYLSLPVKLYLAFGITGLSMASYYTLEWRVRRGGRGRRERTKKADIEVES